MIQELPSDKGLFTFYKQQQKAEDQLQKAHLMKAKCKTSIKTMLKKRGKDKDKINAISFQEEWKEDDNPKTGRSQGLVQASSLKRKKTLDLDLWKNRKEGGKNHSQIIGKTGEKLNHQNDRQSLKHLKDHLRNLIGIETPQKSQDKDKKQINEHIKQFKSRTEQQINKITNNIFCFNKQKIIFENENQLEWKKSLKIQKKKGNLIKIGLTKSIPNLNKVLSQKFPKIEKNSRGKSSEEYITFCAHINNFKYINPQRYNKEPVMLQVSTQKNPKREYHLNFELISTSKEEKENILVQTPSFPSKINHNIFSDIKFQQLISKIKFN